MPTYQPAQHGVSFSAAYAEAVAVAPDHRVLLETLEMRHSAFRDAAGQPYALRIVNDRAEFIGTLEATAPMDAGQAVPFEPLPVRIAGPDETDSAETPSIGIAIDGVSGHAAAQLDLAVQTLEPVYVTVRYYASDDPSGPAMLPVLTMILRDVEVGETQVTGRLAMGDPANKAFPRKEYLPSQYPGLSA